MAIVIVLKWLLSLIRNLWGKLQDGQLKVNFTFRSAKQKQSWTICVKEGAKPGMSGRSFRTEIVFLKTGIRTFKSHQRRPACKGIKMESLTFLTLEKILDTEVTVEEIEHCIKAMKLGR